MWIDWFKTAVWIIVAIAVVIFLSIVITEVRADGDPTDKGSSYTTIPLRGSYRDQPCPAGITPRQCRIINFQARKQRLAEPRRAYSVRREPAYTRRDVAQGRPRDDDDRPRRSGRCAPYMKVEGDARWTEGLALGSARKEWRKAVRISDRAGESYMDEKYSPDFRLGKCRIVGDRGIDRRCVAEGTPCQAH